MKYAVIVNVNLQLEVDADNPEDAQLIATEYELPHEYVEDSYEFVKVLDKDGNEIK